MIVKRTKEEEEDAVAAEEETTINKEGEERGWLGKKLS